MSSQINDGVPIYRPKPRRPFELTPLTSTVPQGPGSDSRTDLPAWVNGDPLSPTSANGTTTPNDFTKRTKSVLNLTASTLFGIYSSTYNDGTEPPTPSSSSFMSRTNSMVNVSDTTSNGNTNNVNGVEKGTNTNRNASSSPDQSPRRRHRRGKPTSLPRLILRLSALLGFGIGYGVIVMHLHNTKTFTPAWWEEIEGYNPGYLLLWGLVGVALGSLLPWIDYFFDEQEDGAADGMVDWMQVVRSIGAFVGIAYAIRKLPWQSTLQISLTLSLVNPFLWYLVDRTRAGFLLSVFVGIAGTMILCQINPGMIQAPETYTDRLARQTAATTDKPEEMLMGYISYETVGVGAWMWSVLFCSCVCFGNIGRKLAFRERDL